MLTCIAERKKADKDQSVNILRAVAVVSILWKTFHAMKIVTTQKQKKKAEDTVDAEEEEW